MYQYSYTGINTTHNPGEFWGADNPNLEKWRVIQHCTDFLYGKSMEELYEGKAGQVLIVPPGNDLFHGPKKGAKTGFVDDCIIFYSSENEETLKQLNLPVCGAIDVQDKSLLRRFITKVSEERMLKQPGYIIRISSLIGEMLVEIAREYEKQQCISSPQMLTIEKVRKEMLLSYSKPWTVELLAELAGYSSSHFTHLYKKYYNCSPIDELLQHRLMIAKDELAKKHLSVTEISRKCGFVSLYHFSQYFKKQVGVSPSKFCKER